MHGVARVSFCAAVNVNSPVSIHGESGSEFLPLQYCIMPPADPDLDFRPVSSISLPLRPSLPLPSIEH
jgi:hypothetical protein